MKNSAKMDIYVGGFQTQSLVWGIYARLAKKIADCATDSFTNSSTDSLFV